MCIAPRRHESIPSTASSCRAMTSRSTTNGAEAEGRGRGLSRSATSPALQPMTRPQPFALEDYVEPAGEVAPVRREELPETRVREVGAYVARVEPVRQIEAAHRQPNAVVAADAELLGQLGVKRDEPGKSGRITVALADEILLLVPDGVRKTGSRLEHRRQSHPARQREAAPGNEPVRDVLRQLRVLVRAQNRRREPAVAAA